jgi:hypothetical protein
LQDPIKARDFRAMITGDGFEPPEFQSYEDLPGRHLDSTRPGEVTWIDIEPMCFQNAQQVREQGSINTEHGLITAIYGNRESIYPIFGDSTELADYGCPLIYADYRPPLYNTFKPFNGWQRPAAWQCSSLGLHLPRGLGSVDINADLLIAPAA